MAYATTNPLSSYYGTFLQSKVTSFDRLYDRISYSLGYPMVNIEVHRNQVYDFISIAAEMFTKYAGYTEEFLIFDSSLYTGGKGIRLDKLFSITPELSTGYVSQDLSLSENNPRAKTVTLTSGTTAALQTFEIKQEDDDPSEFVIKMVDSSTKHSRVGKMLVTTQFQNGSGSVTTTEYGTIHTSSNDLLTLTTIASGASSKHVVIIADPNATGNATILQNDYATTASGLTASQNSLGSYDTLIENYQQVIDVHGFEEGSTTGINTLFTVEQTLAQQTYFSYAMGQYGFDLISWYTVKEWLDTREKMLSQRRAFKFNQDTQYLQIIPEPKGSTFYGIVQVYLEKPLLYILKEPWVYQYALALTKIGVARARGKYGGTSLFGGGTIEYNDLLSEGNAEKEKLETALYEGTPGLGDAPPPMFFIG